MRAGLAEREDSFSVLRRNPAGCCTESGLLFFWTIVPSRTPVNSRSSCLKVGSNALRSTQSAGKSRRKVGTGCLAFAIGRHRLISIFGITSQVCPSFQARCVLASAVADPPRFHGLCTPLGCNRASIFRRRCNRYSWFLRPFRKCLTITVPSSCQIAT